MQKKYSDWIAEWLKADGYTHCFFVAGGNIMHLLESLSHHLECVPVVHEVAAGVAAEYFNATSTSGKALALVTAGPGLTNIVTALAGAYLESRELLVIGGQVKTSDLALGQLRQRGIQEVDGVAIAKPVTVVSRRLDAPVSRAEFSALCASNENGRHGPVFIELPLDVQGRQLAENELPTAQPDVPAAPVLPAGVKRAEESIDEALTLLGAAKRPAFLIGGGVSRETAAALAAVAERHDLPLFTTWNGMDRVPADHRCYFGRPNTWGQRYANLLLQQADVIFALGTRLGLQQTGFNWQEFGLKAKVVQIDCDPAELAKGHPRVDLPVCADVNAWLVPIMQRIEGQWPEWLHHCEEVKKALPLVEENATREGYLSPFRFVERLSTLARADDVVIPCSSGGAFTVMMQTFAQKVGQRIVTNKGLAAMGYGLSGAIGAAFANRDRRVILVEGDGGFSQNLQEVGTVGVNKLNLKMFVFDDSGYASIRMTQRNYFGGRYVGCDLQTGLGLPNWEALFAAYGVPAVRVGVGYENDPRFIEQFEAEGPCAFLVTIDPEQTYFPKITSRVTPTGMASNPLHKMSPELSEELYSRVAKYLM
ncbi:thiamine pyrophosphate-binding protein [Trinickia caryophylli]|uniref:Acetolactate synthase-1/2/3 large subunit n=1 Tax=Trinickia caryophylli TaxID=28094 RepID=A0A1X7CCK8_TRICW|nr:thiamine pyrophosphate-binding protein [Trinickia caryophylli]PMS12505.1 thiamine pyrophosphate-binding protein [Trinickia caryophylli]TRX19709.1 thiamine pyrophosphate-binding protein [Trinickia caryophylli]WQE12978.1 thiamine pyrophosphate-binding protein [Trinickia caryophylli]SME94105.1 acetolactate synthase-1/2/3 large subunit [Trinickia caryophylli]GLU30708.1 acetolactate synthase, large subunit, biosynthetic type [Trinickia caryophylli]